MWPFALEETNPGDRFATSPLFQGPAIIEHIFINSQDDNTAPRPTITISYGIGLPPSGNAVLSATQLGTMIFTDGVISTEDPNVYQGPLQHIPKFQGAGQTTRFPYILRFPIYQDQFQLMVRYGTQTAGQQLLAGYVRLLERVPPDLIPNFL